MANEWYLPFSGGIVPPDRATAVNNIIADINTVVTTSPDGATTIDVPALMVLAAQRISSIPDPTSPYRYTTPDMLRSVNVRPQVDQLVQALGGLSSAAEVPDLQPHLSDLIAKADKVTQYYRKATEQDVTNLLLTGLGFKIDSNIPPAETINYESRFYRATFVTDWEEESAPSDVSAEVQVGQKDTVTVNRPTVPSGRFIAHWRIYRSNSGNAGAAFQYVPNSANVLGVPAATASFLDNVKKSALQEVCPSTLWDEPPTNLAGLVAMANGINAGFFSRTLCPTPAYVFHAFPRAYRKSVPDEIVGLAAWEQTVFVGTRGKPAFLTGSDPAALTVRVLDSNQACVSARSICPTAAGVVYASPDGLCLATPAGVRVITEGHFTREEWQALSPSSMAVSEHDGVIYVAINVLQAVSMRSTFNAVYNPDLMNQTLTFRASPPKEVFDWDNVTADLDQAVFDDRGTLVGNEATFAPAYTGSITTFNGPPVRLHSGTATDLAGTVKNESLGGFEAWGLMTWAGKRAAPVELTHDPHWSSVKLLLHGDGTNNSTTIIDSGPQARAVTPADNANIRTVAGWRGGATIRLDGAGDYLSVPDSPDWHFGAGDFTVEATIQPDGTNFIPLFAQNASFGSNDGRVIMGYWNGAWQLYYQVDVNTIGTMVSVTMDLVTGSRYDIAFMRRGNRFFVTINSVIVGAGFSSDTLPDVASPLYIGTSRISGAQQYANIWVDEYRVTKGVCRINPDVAVPKKPAASNAAADPYYARVSLLLAGDGTNGSTSILDSGPDARTVTVADNAQVSTAQNPFGSGSSILLDGTGDYLQVPHDFRLTPCGNHWTLDVWVRPTSAGAVRTIASKRPAGGAQRDWTLSIAADGKVNFTAWGLTDANQPTVGVNMTSQTAPALNAWVHLQVVRVTGERVANISYGFTHPTWYLFVGGVLEAVFTHKALLGRDCTADDASPLFVGRDPTNTALDFAGYIKDFRITHGVARSQPRYQYRASAFPDTGTPARGLASLYALDVASGKLVTVDAGDEVSALYADRATDALYAAAGTDAHNLFGATVRRTGTWKKLLVLDEFETFAWCEVTSDFTDADGAAASVTLNIYNAAGTLLASATVSNREPVRLAPFCEQEIQLEVVSKAKVSLVRLAGDAAELSK